MRVYGFLADLRYIKTMQNFYKTKQNDCGISVI